MSALLASAYTSGFGAAAASGSVSFYQFGTLTPAVVFSRDDLTQPQTQPIILDSLGRTPLPVYTATPLRAIVKDSSGATLQDIERIDGDRAELVGVNNPDWPGATDLNSILSLLRTSVGGINGTFLDPGPGAVSRLLVTKFEEVQVSVKDFGAKGDNLTDDTSAIQGAINRVLALGGGVVYVPPGTYLISSALTVPFPVSNNAANMAIRGAGRTTSIIKSTSGSASGITVTARSVELSDLTVTATSSTGTGITLSANVVNQTLQRLIVSGFTNGITGVGSNQAQGFAILLGVQVDLIAGSTGAELSGDFLDTIILGGALNLITQGVTSIGIKVTESGFGANSSLVVIGLRNILGSFRLDVPAVGLASIVIVGGVWSSGFIRLAAGTTSNVTRIGSALNAAGVLDGRTGLPVAVSLSGNGSATPIANVPMRIAQNTAATTVTINIPANNPFMGDFVEVMCLNISGGAVTWTPAGSYRTSAAIAPANNQGTQVRFVWDAITAVYREVARQTTAF